MSNLVAFKNSRGVETVRLSDDDLHRAARKSLHDGNHVVFGILPTTIRQLIEHKVWKSRGPKFNSFGEYALDQTSEGLGIENNQLLWLLRCSLDVDGSHVNEWASVLEEVEISVKVSAKAAGKKLRDFDGNSLETLGKVATHGSQTITFLPSGNKKLDGQLIRLRKKSPETYRKVLAGQIGVREAIRAAGMHRKDSDVNRDPFDRAIMYIQRMKKSDIKRLVAWLSDKGHINGATR